MRILLDVDGVLVESNYLNIERLNKEFGTDYSYEDIDTVEYTFLTDEQREFIYEECWHDPELYDSRHLSMKWRLTIDALENCYDVRVCSSPLLGHIESKLRFLLRYFDREQIILAPDKTIIEADVLVDDGPHNIEPFPGESIVYDRPWNESLSTAEYPRAYVPFDVYYLAKALEAQNDD